MQIERDEIRKENGKYFNLVGKWIIDGSLDNWIHFHYNPFLILKYIII